jgi:prepilin peptidase CpaA
MVISLLLLFQQEPSVLVTVVAVYLLVICAIDTFYSKIPNLCNLTLLLVGLTYHPLQNGFFGLWHALLGFAVGLSLLLVPYLLGGIGGGDVKALAALGTLLGPGAVFQVFLYIGPIGGVLAILHYLFQKSLWLKIVGAGRALLAFAGTCDVNCLRPEVQERLRFPYAAAIAFGFFCYVNFGEIFSVLRAFLGETA